MPTITLDAFQTMGVAIIFLFVGKLLRSNVNFFERFAIPAPVIGGTFFALVAWALREFGILAFEYDETFRNLFMTMFFCSVGFNASVQVLKQGGKKVVIFLLCAAGLMFVQNVVAVALGPVVGLDQGLALMTGSTPMTGGHGTAGAIGPDAEARGVENAESVAITAATFGLIAGSLMGGPLGTRLIEKNNLAEKDLKKKEEEESEVDMSLVEGEDELDEGRFLNAFFILVLATGLGVFLTNWINMGLTALSNAVGGEGITMPIYIGPMILGIILRNVFEGTKNEIPNTELQIIGDACLQIFLAIALMTVRLWELTELLGQLGVLLLAQIVLMYLYARFVTFNVMGGDYDAALLAGGHCGFGMGATPNGVANLQSLTDKFHYSPIPFFVLPIVGGFFVDFVNIFIINIFMGIFV